MQSTYNFVTANSRSSGSPSDKQPNQQAGKYYKKRGSQDDEKRDEGKSAYYTNKNAGSSHNAVTKDQLKESTRFSSNERHVDKEARSRGSSNNKNSAREYTSGGNQQQDSSAMASTRR